MRTFSSSLTIIGHVDGDRGVGQSGVENEHHFGTIAADNER